MKILKIKKTKVDSGTIVEIPLVTEYPSHVNIKIVEYLYSKMFDLFKSDVSVNILKVADIDQSVDFNFVIDYDKHEILCLIVYNNNICIEKEIKFGKEIMITYINHESRFKLNISDYESSIKFM